MKRKFFSVLLTLVLVLSMSIVMAPPVAASSVSSVWVEFAAGGNNINNAALYTIHFTTGSALSRGVDTITVIFPDGLDSTMGPVTTQDSFDFEFGSADTTASYYSVDPDGAGTTYGYTASTATATIAGYRVQVTTPVDIPASTAATLKIATGATITTPAVAASTYKIKVATSQDTTFALSSAFPVDNTVLAALISTANYPSSLVAGAASAYKWTFEVATTVAIGGTVTVEFPVGTYLPSTIDTAYVTVGNGSDDPPASAVSVNTTARTVTVTTAEALSSTGKVLYFLTAAGIKNKTTLGHLDVHMWTSTDGQKFGQTDSDTIVAGTATKLAFTNNTALGRSDDATILYAFTQKLFIDSVDAYGHLKAASPTEPTIALSVTTGSGAFYTAQNTSNPYSNTAISSGILGSSNAIYYRPTSVGTHTLKAEVVSGTSLTLATWTVYVAPTVVLKDASDQTIGTYGPTSTSTTDSSYGGAAIQSAIDAAFPGDTVELGEGIYELSTVITLDKKITLTEASGASATLRPTAEMDKAINVTTSGTAANPVIIDGLTFTRLRSALEFDVAIGSSGKSYITIRNNAFNYIMPDASGTTEAVIWFLVGNAAVSNITVSDNTFDNCVAFNGISGGRTGVIQFYDAGGSNALTAVTVSGNTITDSNDYAIAVGSSAAAHTITISNNTIINGYSAIMLADGMLLAKVTGNTITDAYNYAIRVEGTGNTAVTIKNNTITGTAGSYAIKVDEDLTTAITIQYNHFSGNNGYDIQSTGAAQDSRYNWYGSASGPVLGTDVSTLVTYSPWLHKSLADVVAANASYPTFSRSLVVGWNTLSVPGKLISTADSLDEMVPAGMTIAYKYDNGWVQVTTGVINPLDGIYIKMASAQTVLLKVDGAAFSTPTKSLAVGWNLIGLASLTSKTDLEAVGSIPSTSFGQLVSPSMNASEWVYVTGTTAGALVVGEGYWIYVSSAATLAGFTILPMAPSLT